MNPIEAIALATKCIGQNNEGIQLSTSRGSDGSYGESKSEAVYTLADLAGAAPPSGDGPAAPLWPWPGLALPVSPKDDLDCPSPDNL